MTSVSPEFVLLITAIACALTAAATDLHERRIPNWLTGPVILAGLTVHAVAGGWRELASSLAALLLCGGVFLLFHLAGGMGAGDVKLIAALGCLLGLSNAAPLLAYTALCGGALALGLAVKRGMLGQTLRNVLALTSHHSRRGLTPHPELNVLNASTLRLPYALAIAAGCCATVALQPGLRELL